MNPIVAMLEPVATSAMAGPGQVTDGGAEGAGGFADALQQATGSHRQEPPQAKPDAQGPTQSSRGSHREASAAAAADGHPPQASGDGDDSAPEDGDALEPRDREATAEREPMASGEPQDTGTAVAMPTATTSTTAPPDLKPGDDTGVDSAATTVDAVGGAARRWKPAAPAAHSSGVRAGEAADATDSVPGQPDGEQPATGRAGKPATGEPTGTTTAAGLATQAAALPAGAVNGDGPRPAGTQSRRSPGATSVTDRAGHGNAATVDGAAARILANHAWAPGSGRGTPEIATTKDLAPAVARADGGSPAGFEDALLALAHGSDPGAAVTTASTSAGTAGGLRPIALPIATPVHSPAFPQALGQQLAMALRMDLGQAELILSPAELGPVRIELSLDGDAASVHFAAINPETRQALEQSLPQLRALFAEQGLSLADTHVGPGFHRESDGRPADAPQRWPADPRPDAAIDGGIRPMNAPTRPDALVDLFA